MSLSNDLISQFVKITNDNKKERKETTMYGTVKMEGNKAYVTLDGANYTGVDDISHNTLIPIDKKSTASVKDGDRVTVLIKNHTAIITGNLYDPSAPSQSVEELDRKVSSFDSRIIECERLAAKTITTDVLNARLIETEEAIVGRLDARYLTVDDAVIKNLETDVGTINTLIFGSATGDVIQTEFSNAVIAQVGNAQIKSAMIESIVTDNVSILSEGGRLLIDGETIQIKDVNETVRVQIGRDGAGDYSILVWNENGDLIFDKGGITEDGIVDGLIRDDMINENANIAAGKIFLSEKGQTLDVAFKSLSTEVSDAKETISSQGTQISAIVGQIKTKVWQQDIDTAKNEMSTQYSTLTQTMNSISTTVSSHASELNGMTIGGRNLVRDSKMDRDTDMWSYSTKQCSASFDNGHLEITRTYDANYTSRSFNSQYSDQNPQLLPDNISGETYILQAEFKILDGYGVSSASSIFWRVYYDDSTLYEEATLFFPTDLTEGEWKRCYIAKTFGTRNWTSGQISIAMANSNHGICIRNIMLEKATKPSNWVPAVEDSDVRLSAAETRIIQNAESIELVASKTSENSSTIASLELAAEGLTAKIDDAAKTATNYLNFSSAGLVIGDMTASTLGKNVLIDSDSVDIRNGTTTLASFGADHLYLAKNSRNATIDLCDGLAKLYHQSKYSYDTIFVIDTGNTTEIMGSLTPLCITSTKTSGHVTIQFANANGVIGEIGMYNTGTNQWITRNVPSTASTYSVLDTGNFDAIMDSGWINCSLNTGSFTRYSNDLPQPQVRKIGKQVYLRGEAKPVVATTPESDSDTVIATIPSGYRPAQRKQFIMQGSGSYRWLLSIHTDGRMAISRYSNSTTANMNIAAGAWLCCHAQWLID